MLVGIWIALAVMVVVAAVEEVAHDGSSRLAAASGDHDARHSAPMLAVDEVAHGLRAHAAPAPALLLRDGRDDGERHRGGHAEEEAEPEAHRLRPVWCISVKGVSWVSPLKRTGPVRQSNMAR